VDRLPFATQWIDIFHFVSQFRMVLENRSRARQKSTTAPVNRQDRLKVVFVSTALVLYEPVSHCILQVLVNDLLSAEFVSDFLRSDSPPRPLVEFCDSSAYEIFLGPAVQG